MTETSGSAAASSGIGAGVDLLVVGGGINGCGIARDAAGRGLSVLLCEQDDLAAHTSSASTKLIHGGLRYLELGHFRLVHESLREREVLLASAPHIMRPLRFVLPHAPHLRPAWMIRAGLLLYDHLARRRLLPRSAEIDLLSHPAGAPLHASERRAFVYSDVQADDSRLVVLNALDAAERGTRILTRTCCTRLQPDPRGGWIAELATQALHDGGEATPRDATAPLCVHARAVVNAAGPWVARFLASATPLRAAHDVRLVKGSHIVVPQLFAHRFAYIFQNEDRRIGFAIPWESQFTLIGTTDIAYQGDPSEVRISADETTYLCEMANRWFARRIGPGEVLWSFAGVRPLLDDESADLRKVTRDWTLDLEQQPGPLLSVYGGKLTTYRRLAEQAVNRLAPLLGCRAGPWTARAHLPGGDLPESSFAVLLRTIERRYPWLPAPLRTRFAHAYGTRVERAVGAARSLADLGEALAPQLYEREVEYLCREEWACTAEDILWRRSKLGLHLGPETVENLTRWLSGHRRRRELGVPIDVCQSRP